MIRTRNKNYDLPQTQTNFRGVGIPGLTAEQLQRTKRKALYKRSDGVCEVFKIVIIEAGELFGVQIPKHEHYPNNDDFGRIAWTYHSEKLAQQHYNRI